MRQSGPSPSRLLARLRDEVRRRTAAAQLETVKALVLACFREQREPDGTLWSDRADGTGRPLLLTIGDALEFFTDGGTVYVDCPSKPHAEFQYWGTRTVPSRQWTPPPGTPLPPAWQAQVDRSVRDFIREAWRAAH